MTLARPTRKGRFLAKNAHEKDAPAKANDIGRDATRTKCLRHIYGLSRYRSVVERERDWFFGKISYRRDALTRRRRTVISRVNSFEKSLSHRRSIDARQRPIVSYTSCRTGTHTLQTAGENQTR